MQEQVFKTLRDESSDQNLGPLVVIRNYKQGGAILTFNGGEKSEAPLAKNTEIVGIYEGVKESETPKGKKSIEHKIRSTDGSNTLYMLRGCSSLNNTSTGLGAVAPGTLVQVVFKKMVTTKSGNDFAVFEVATADSAIED